MLDESFNELTDPSHAQCTVCHYHANNQSCIGAHSWTSWQSMLQFMQLANSPMRLDQSREVQTADPPLYPLFNPTAKILKKILHASCDSSARKLASIIDQAGADLGGELRGLKPPPSTKTLNSMQISNILLNLKETVENQPQPPLQVKLRYLHPYTACIKHCSSIHA